jgi:hypothetical protein
MGSDAIPTYHRGARNYGTGYDMIERIEELEAAIQRSVIKLDLTGLVRGLVWQDFEGRGAKASAFYQASYMITYWRGRDEFEASMSYPGYQTGYDGPCWHKTLDAAKAAAQADYAARILSAIDTDAIARAGGNCERNPQ